MSDIITVTTGTATATGAQAKALAQNKYKKVLFIDTAAEVSDADVKDLEEAGFKVVKVVGCPHQTVCPVSFY